MNDLQTSVVFAYGAIDRPLKFSKGFVKVFAGVHHIHLKYLPVRTFTNGSVALRAGRDAENFDLKTAVVTMEFHE